MHAHALHDVAADCVDQRPDQPGNLADYIRQCRVRQVDVVAGIDLGLPVQRWVLAVLGHHHVGE